MGGWERQNARLCICLSRRCSLNLCTSAKQQAAPTRTRACSVGERDGVPAYPNQPRTPVRVSHEFVIVFFVLLLLHGYLYAERRHRKSGGVAFYFASRQEAEAEAGRAVADAWEAAHGDHQRTMGEELCCEPKMCECIERNFKNFLKQQTQSRRHRLRRETDNGSAGTLQLAPLVAGDPCRQLVTKLKHPPRPGTAHRLPGIARSTVKAAPLMPGFATACRTSTKKPTAQQLTFQQEAVNSCSA